MSSALARRFRFGAQTLVLLGALLVVCVLTAVLGSRFSTRIDLTATREHTLAPRTIRLVEQIDEPHLIVVSANLSRVDAAGRQRLTDVLQNFAAINQDLTVSLIDTGAPGAIEAIQAVVATAASWHEDDIEAHVEAITQTLDDAGAMPQRVEGVADALAGLAATLAGPDERSRWNDASGAVRVLADDMRSATEVAAATAATRIGAVELPDAENTLAALAPAMRQVARATSTILEQLPPTADADALAGARIAAAALRDDILAAMDRLRRLEALEPLAIARILAAQESVLVIGPRGASAIEFSAMFPAATSDRSIASVVFTGENLLATALSSVSRDSTTALVFVHPDTERIFGTDGMPTQRGQAVFGALIQDLSQRGIRLAEWAVAFNEPMPDRRALGLESNEPVVWFVVGRPTAPPQRIERLNRLGESITRLIDAGENILLSLTPSELPAVGEPDPLVTSLPVFGIESDSGRVIVTRTTSPIGPQFAPDIEPRTTGDHPIAGALATLTTYFPLAMPLRQMESVASARTWVVMDVPDDGDRWAESQWQTIVAGMTSANPPEPNDRRDDLEGPWPVVMAAERSRGSTQPAAIESGDGGRQRLLVVSGGWWYTDAVTQAAVMLDGRRVTRFPGNAELLDAAIAWLSGNDELIAESPEARSIPRIAQLEPTQLTAIRWLLIAGLPVLVLGLGLALRVIRG
ncbi:MAG: hypothetical protein AAFX05_03845 [Planctomycetota bacterium]